MLTDEEGEFLVRVARLAIEEYVSNGRRIRPDCPYESLKEKRGVFVTIRRLLDGRKELRGCIGFPEPLRSLIEHTVEAAIAAATEDPRFYPLGKEELDSILVEVSVLTPLERIEVESPRDYPSKIKVGRDGLVVKWKFLSGLLLPQVPKEFGWDEVEFLSQTCMKAGAPPDCWLTEDAVLYRFQAEIFEEESPRGRVRRVEP